MYRKSNQPELTPSKFKLPVAVELSSDNRWVIMAELIPWAELARSLAEETSAGSLVNIFRFFKDWCIHKDTRGEEASPPWDVRDDSYFSLSF